MELMPSKMISYFYVELLLLIVCGNIELVYSYFILSNYLGKRSTSQRIDRKKRVFQNKMVKLLCGHHQNHRNISVTQVRIKKNKN